MSADIGALIEPLQPYAKALVDLGARAGVQPRVTSTLRSHSQQQRLYDAYLRGESRYPVAPPGMSAHEFGYAFDMVASSTEDLHDLGTVWRNWGGLWTPQDEVHFEYPGFVPGATQEAPASGCDFSDVKNWVLWSPACACRVVDFLKAPIVGSLLELGWPDSEIAKFLAHPCGTILSDLQKLGI